MSVLKDIVLWRYGRTTWQYDVMCVLILAFIFLTPKSWFRHGELRGGAAHRNLSGRLLLDVPPGEPLDRAQVERRVRALVGDRATFAGEARPVTDAAGRVVAYEVDLK